MTISVSVALGAVTLSAAAADVRPQTANVRGVRHDLHCWNLVSERWKLCLLIIIVLCLMIQPYLIYVCILYLPLINLQQSHLPVSMKSNMHLEVDVDVVKSELDVVEAAMCFGDG
jgi:hypothetical protein